MRLLLDTHILLWWLTDDPRLSANVRAAISDPRNDVLVSAASAWEMSIKQALGKLAVPDDLSAEIRRQGMVALPVDIDDGLRAGSLPHHHRDPFDRMLIAQAIRHRLVLASTDSQFGDYDVVVLG